MLPRLKHSGLPNDHLHYAARSEAFRRASNKKQWKYMAYRRAMIKWQSKPMAFRRWENMNLMWVKSTEAAEIMKCTPNALCRAVRIASKKSHIRVRNIEAGPSTRAHKLYCREDLEKAAVGRVKAKRREQDDTPVTDDGAPSMWHPAMTRPWTPEGLRGVTG